VNVTVDTAVVPDPVLVQPTCTVPAVFRAAGGEAQLPRTIWAVFPLKPVLMKPPPLVVAVQLTGEADRHVGLLW
jgi:hypothetical protein